MSEGPVNGHDVGSGWSAYIQAVLVDHGWSNNYLADAIGCHQTLIGRWIKGDAHPSVKYVRAVCELLGRDIRGGLIAAGLLTPKELRMWMGPARPELTMFDDEELLAELMQRRQGRVRGAELVESSVSYEQDGSPDSYIEVAGAGADQPPLDVTRNGGRALPQAGG